MTRLQGCGTALVTPFTERGEVDYAALRALVEWQIAEGIDFLVPCGSTGEAQTLEDAERERVVAIVVETAAGRVPVMAGASSNDTSRAVAEARRMCRVGADYILTATPYYNKPSQGGLHRHFSAVADASSKPICLYNVPGRTAVNLQPGVALQLAEYREIVAEHRARRVRRDPFLGSANRGLRIVLADARQGGGPVPERGHGLDSAQLARAREPTLRHLVLAAAQRDHGPAQHDAGVVAGPARRVAVSGLRLVEPPHPLEREAQVVKRRGAGASLLDRLADGGGRLLPARLAAPPHRRG